MDKTSGCGFVKATEVESIVSGRRRKKMVGTPFALVRLDDLLGTGYALPHSDVLSNMRPHIHMCEQCSTLQEPVPWLRRSDVRVIPLLQVTRRVHIVLLFGDAHRGRNDYDQHFLLNTTADPCYGGPADRIVYLRCVISTCAGLLPKPPQKTPDVRSICPTCGHPQPWI